jgi:DNA-directed RNA polymerase subunit RPC12/RpoP
MTTPKQYIICPRCGSDKGFTSNETPSDELDLCGNCGRAYTSAGMEIDGGYCPECSKLPEGGKL